MARQDRNWRGKWILITVLVTSLLASLLIASIAFAAPKEPIPQGTLDDGGTAEVGVEWINDFEGTVNDRSHWDESCDGLWNGLRDEGWVGRFRYTDWGAWEEDWKRSAAGGYEYLYADTVDLAMLCTHGSTGWDSFWGQNLSTVYFGDGAHDDHDLTPGDAYRAWGTDDLEWLALDSCSVLRETAAAGYPYRSYWAGTMDGLHLLLGFSNTMYVVEPGDGERWAHYLLGHKFLWWWIHAPRTVKQAWFDAVDDVQPGGVCARVLAQETDNLNDYIWGKGYVSADYGYDGSYTYRDHCSCTPKPVHVANVDMIETLPVYEVENRVIDVQYVLDIAEAFDMTGGAQDVYTDDENYYMMNATGGITYTLQVDRTTGGYKYENLSKLSVAPIDPPNLLGEPQALARGNAFFAGAGQALPAAEFRNGPTLTMTEQQVEVTMPTRSVYGVQGAPTESAMPVLVSVSWGRVINPTVGVMTAQGIQPLQTTLSIVGPGARTKMYLGDMGETLGVQGGSRVIQSTGAQVDLMDASKAWDLYLQDPTIALVQIPWVADTITYSDHTLGYYEQPHLKGQKEIIPSWIFTSTFASGSTVLAENVAVYLPAAAVYIRPGVEITSPAGGSSFRAGQAITFEGAVVEYGKAPFTYEWSSDHDGVLGTGPQIVASLSPSLREGEVMTHKILLKVTDANGQVGSAQLDVLVRPSIYLPATLRGQ
jgi:hypothetical protein